jgi:hypothetical protein
MSDRLFAGVYPTGISYADRSQELNGDYKPIAHLFFHNLHLDIDDPKSPLLDEVKADAAKIQARWGEEYQVSSGGQTITLGYAMLPLAEQEVTCRSGERGWRGRLKDCYDFYEQWERYCGYYGLARLLGYDWPSDAWIANPLVECSTNPTDFRVVFPRSREEG